MSPVNTSLDPPQATASPRGGARGGSPAPFELTPSVPATTASSATPKAEPPARIVATHAEREFSPPARFPPGESPQAPPLPISSGSVTPSIAAGASGLDLDGGTTPQRGKKREKLLSPPSLQGMIGSTPTSGGASQPRVGGVLPPALALSQGRDGSEKKRSTFSSLLVPSTPVRNNARGMLGSVSFSTFDVGKVVSPSEDLARHTTDILSGSDTAGPTTFAELVACEMFAESPIFVLQCERAGGIDPALEVTKFQTISFDEEFGRYAGGPSSRADGDGECDDGACECDAAHITKDMRGFDYSKYQAADLYHSCFVCKRRPATFLCIQTFDGVCASHVGQYYERKNHVIQQAAGGGSWPFKPHQCSLFINILDINTSFDRIFWCERCRRFTWKFTEVYEPLTDQIASTKGTYMPTPVLDAHVREYFTRIGAATGPVGLRAVGASVQGWRSGQEDAEAAFVLTLGGGSQVAVYCVFDGHGGDAVARLAAQNVERFTTAALMRHHHSHMDEAATKEQVQSFFSTLLNEALLDLDQHIHSTQEGEQGDYNCVGCTACVVAVTSRFIVCANVGDSGAAVVTKTGISMISKPHRITDDTEVRRIRNAGYSICDGRIEGLLAVPRALGDYDFKQCGGMTRSEQAVSPSPDLQVVALPARDAEWCVVLACDGVWDTIDSDKVRDALIASLNPRQHPLSDAREVPSIDTELSARMLDKSLLSGALGLIGNCVSLVDDAEGNGMDNVSVMLVQPLYHT